MIEAVFISDLHLHPNHLSIGHRFNQFIEWVITKTCRVYILGDFFHAWPGDDAINAWSMQHLNRLCELNHQGIAVYFMRGNRDFLIGSQFADKACVTLLTEPTVIFCNQQPVLLVHGDSYCTQDKAHQWLRRLTRNRWFAPLFLKLPFGIRTKLVASVRTFSRTNPLKSPAVMDVVADALLSDMKKHGVTTLIHGHTHKPGKTVYQQDSQFFERYVLSDWDDSPEILCYDSSKGFYFTQMNDY